MALDWFVEPSRSTLGDDDTLTGVLPGLLQGTLPFLVTGVNFLWKTAGRLEGVEKKKSNKDHLPQLSRIWVSFTSGDLCVCSSSANTGMSTSQGTQGLLGWELPPRFSCDTTRLWIPDIDCQVPSKPGTAEKTVPVHLGFGTEFSDNNSLLLQPWGKHFSVCRNRDTKLWLMFSS